MKKQTSHIGEKIGRGITKGALEQLKDSLFSPTGIIFIIGVLIILHEFRSQKIK